MVSWTRRDAVQARRPRAPCRVARGDGDGVEAGVAVGDEVAVAHDEAGADAADAPVLAARQARQVVQRKSARGLVHRVAAVTVSVATRRASFAAAAGKLTCSSRTVRDFDLRAELRAAGSSTHSCTSSSGRSRRP